MTIRIECEGAATLPIEMIEDFQGTLKIRTADEADKILRSIEKFGFSFPFFIWRDGDRNRCLDGHGRLQALKVARKRGEDLPEFPVAWVEAKDEAEAKNKLLRLNSQYGTMTEESVLEFIGDLDVEFGDLALPGAKFLDFAPKISDVTEDGYEPKPLTEVKTEIQAGQLFQVGPHRLMCGDSTNRDHVDLLLDGAAVDLVVTDPPYNVDYEGGTRDHLKIMNDRMGDVAFREFLKKFYTTWIEVTKPGEAWYVWHADSEGVNFRATFEESGLLLKQCLIWVKNSLVLGRRDYQWKHEPCQPAGTLVRKVIEPRATEKGRQWAFSQTQDVPIETLKDGDVVVSYNSTQAIVHQRGRPIKIASREYDGLMVDVTCDGKTTRATADHRFTIKLDEGAADSQIIYLMRKSERWRIGQVRLFNTRGFGLASRLADEDGDVAWILAVSRDKVHARVLEQALSCRFSIPQTQWRIDPYSNAPEKLRTFDGVEEIYQIIGMDRVKQGASEILRYFRLDEANPILVRGETGMFSREASRTIKAVNLIPGIMQLPVPTEGQGFEWKTITQTGKESAHCQVYSLDVEEDGHYVADGLITHNCLYGWKPGGGHYFTTDRTNSTVIEDRADLQKMSKSELVSMIEALTEGPARTTVLRQNKPAKNDLHPTMKPVILLADLIMNSSRAGELVGDAFIGSGSTMVACHQLDRRCAAMDLDPRYVQVTIDRMKALDPLIEVERLA
jgi:DNA modification methylase